MSNKYRSEDAERLAAAAAEGHIADSRPGLLRIPRRAPFASPNPGDGVQTHLSRCSIVTCRVRVRYIVSVDPATMLPLEIEGAKAELKDDQQEIQEKWMEFRFDEPMDKSLFVFDALRGFAVETRFAPKGDIASSALEDERRQNEKAKEASRKSQRK